MRLSLVVLAALFVSGCMVGGPDEATSSDSDDPTEDDLPPLTSEAALGNNGRTAFNYFVAKGLSAEQSAGIVGNLMQESSVRPTAVEYGGGPGRGIAQWSLGARWNSGSSSLVSFATRTGGNRWALATQLDFVWHELTTISSYGLSELRAASTVTQATVVFQNKYEVCGTCSQTKRLQYAQQTYNDYANTSGGTGTGTGSGGGTGTGSGGTGSGGGSGDVPSNTCYSGTLARDVPANTCVESMYDGLWYQCAYGQWVDRWSDPDACNGEYPL